ncbi:siderophore-interacting protein [Streptomyces abyssomicinicus]|uniref:siderophore-interacting protein n=1 Tax=Streptomyces abyssomicinicus TaxID=574929 RepID=UPI00125039A0|nr:siderophore-interacting protein [Streptomyces abyssomicinicus]
MRTTRTEPATGELLTLHVLRRARISPNFARVTLGGGDIARFVPMGYDQWFRLVLPVAGGTLEAAPKKLDTLSYLRFLTVSSATRPVIRNYSVRAFRPDGPGGPELDVDVVLHGSPEDGTAGPASTWARTCEEGDPVGLLDEGTTFRLPEGVRRILLVADETGLPALVNTLASLPGDVVGHALVEIPDEADRQELGGPAGVEVTWLPRGGVGGDGRGAGAVGALARQAACALPLPEEPAYCWAVGEQALATGVRRHWVAGGLPKTHVTFCGYWRARH